MQRYYNKDVLVSRKHYSIEVHAQSCCSLLTPALIANPFDSGSFDCNPLAPLAPPAGHERRRFNAFAHRTLLYGKGGRGKEDGSLDAVGRLEGRL